MENKYPKDPIEEGKTPLDLEDDVIIPENDCDDFYINDIYGEEDTENNFFDHMDYDYDFFNGIDIFDDLEGLDESDLY